MSADHFDEAAATWDDDPAKVERAATVARGIAGSVPLDRSMRVLEYGAGTGLVTQALREWVGPVTLADSSSGMRDVLHAKSRAGALDGARIWDLDLAAGPAPDDEFDLIVTVLVLHHIPNLTAVLEGFAELLRPGGYLCVADLEQEDGSFHGADFAGHHGFERSALAAELSAAGFVEIGFTRCTHVVRHDELYPVFLATCVRATSKGQDGT